MNSKNYSHKVKTFALVCPLFFCPPLCHYNPMEIRDLQETADLAHLNLEEGELAAAFPAFEQMLGYFAAMQAADQDTDMAPVTAHAEGMTASSRLVRAGYFRNDNPKPGDAETPDAMLEKAGERDGRFVVIPNVL